jgi:hypothetical protein
MELVLQQMPFIEQLKVFVMETNEQGSTNLNQNSSSDPKGQKPTDPTKRENPQKNDPTRQEPGHPDHTDPKPRKNDPTRINPDWNNPEKTDPTHSSNTPSEAGNAPEQKEASNDNYTGDHSAKDRSGEKNYTGTSAGFMAEGKADEEGDNSKKKK